MKYLTKFKFNTTSLSVVVIDNEPWFIANEVCEHLGVNNPSESCSDLDEDEKRLISVRMIGAAGEREILFISESGLYALISSAIFYALNPTHQNLH